MHEHVWMKNIFYCGLFAGLVSINAVQMRAHHENEGLVYNFAVRASTLNNIAGRLRASLMRGGAEISARAGL
jgi:hypothetical protein